MPSYDCGGRITAPFCINSYSPIDNSLYIFSNWVPNAIQDPSPDRGAIATLKTRSFKIVELLFISSLTMGGRLNI